MADINENRTGAESIKEVTQADLDEKMKELSDLEKKMLGDGDLNTGDTVMTKSYLESLNKTETISSKVSLIKDLLNTYSSQYDNKNIKNELKSNNEIDDTEENIKSKLLVKFKNQEEEIRNIKVGIPEVIEDSYFSALNDKITDISSIKELKDFKIEFVNNFHISKIKKIIKEFNLSDDEVNTEVAGIENIIGSDNNFPKYSKENVDNGIFFLNEYTKNNDEILEELSKSLYGKAQSKFDKNTMNIINQKRNFAEIIKKDIDPLRMGLELQLNLNVELKEINQDKVTKDDSNKKRDITNNYFAALTKYLKENDRARSIFLEKAEINNPSDNDIGFKDGLKIGIGECGYMKILLKEIRVVEMGKKVDKMVEKAKSLYNDEGLIQLRAKIIEKIMTSGNDCVLDYVKFFVDFDKEAIEKGWANKLRKVDGKTNKIIPLNEKQVGIDLLDILISDVDEYKSEFTKILIRNNIYDFKLEGATEQKIRDELGTRLSSEDLEKLINLNKKINKTNSQVVVMTKFNSLSSENQTKFLSDFENAKKEGKEPSEAIKILDTYVEKNNEEIKRSISKSYPEAIISPSSNGGAEIKLGNTIMDLNSKELNIIGGNKEKLEKFIDFKKSLDDLGLGFLWKDREVLFQNIKNQKGENSINMLDDNVIGDQEFKNILDYIADKIDIPKKENLNEFKQDFLKIKNERLFSEIDYSRFDNDRVFSEIFRDKGLFEKNTETLRREI